jgi:3-deoxy-manno-octulosonate cytidylyltransferase (CMP-KDO synthetase)
MKKILGLIPTRLNSTRLPQKSLMLINKIPLVVHTYKRALLSKKLDDVYICCDDKKIANVLKKFGVKYIMTSKHHKNGTERIFEGYNKLKKKYDFIIDIQGMNLL